MGCGVEVNDKHNKDLSLFNLANLRWNKIVICTDADVDGYQIRTLILTMLWRLTPTLIQEGYVYIAESPLYEITCKEKTWFAYSDKEKNDIVKELEKPGRDPRDEMPRPILRSDVMDMKDLKPGMILKGTVRNVIDFGAFVDIGVHQDGLVHISQMTDRYIKHPLEAVSVGDVVDVKILSVDMDKKRIALTMKGVKDGN